MKKAEGRRIAVRGSLLFSQEQGLERGIYTAVGNAIAARPPDGGSSKQRRLTSRMRKNAGFPTQVL